MDRKSKNMTTGDIRLISYGAGRSLKDIKDIAIRSQKMLHDVREKMLMPHPRKHPPRFSAAQVASMCGITRQRLVYLAKKGIIPEGERENQRGNRYYSLVDARKAVMSSDHFVPRPENIPGKKIAIGNFKGGVSKTTTAMTLAQGLTLHGRRVLVIDLDPQASLTTLTGILADTEVNEEDTVLPLIYGDQEDLRYAVQETYWDGLDLIPSCVSLFGAEFILPFKQTKNPDFRFWEVLNNGLKPLVNDYDFIIFDTPPALSYMTINAFWAANGLIVPTPPQPLDFASSTQFWSLFSDFTDSMQEQVKDLEKHYDFIHVLVSKVDNNQLSTAVVRDWLRRTYQDMVLPLEIPLTTVTQTASMELGTVYDITRYEGSAKTYQRARTAYDLLVEIIHQQFLVLCGLDQRS